MNKKKLDELFRDTLSDFKEAPDDTVWASIETSLDKKKKKYLHPLIISDLFLQTYSSSIIPYLSIFLTG